MDSNPQTLIQLLDRSLRLHGGRMLFTNCGDPDVTPQALYYAEFGRQVECLRGGLAFMGIERGNVVAITAGNSAEWAMAAYATYGLGAAFVPMYPTQTAEEWVFIIRDSGAKLVFVRDDEAVRRLMRALGDGPRPQIIPICCELGFWSDVFRDLLRFKLRKALDVRPDELAAIIYTSGTTGNPKGVELTHGNIVSNVEATKSVLSVTPDDHTLAFLPWAHAFGHTGELHMMLSAGASMQVLEDPTKVTQHLADAKPTIMLAVPKIFAKIRAGVLKQIESKPAPIKALFRSAMSGNRFSKWLADKLIFSKVRAKFGGRLRYAVSGGAKLGEADAAFMAAIGIPVYEGYGLSETSPVVAVNGHDACRPGSVGKPIPGARVFIADCEDADKRDGEIVAYGPMVMRGYHKMPSETAEVMTESGGFRTGDIGHLDADGYLVITGRLSEVYKLENGNKIAPTPLQDKIKESTLFVNAFVYGLNRPYNVALLAVADGVTEEAAKAELDRLSADWKPYERIRSFALVPDFTQENGLLTPKLSLKRKKVLDLYKTQIDALYQ